MFLLNTVWSVIKGSRTDNPRLYTRTVIRSGCSKTMDEMKFLKMFILQGSIFFRCERIGRYGVKHLLSLHLINWVQNEEE